MPPRAKPKAKGRAAPTSLGESVRTADNVEYMNEFQGYKADLVSNINDFNHHRPPLSMAGGASLPALNATDLATKLAAEEEYIASVNICWLSLRTPTPELPLLKKKVKTLADGLFRFPRSLQVTVG